MTDDPTLVPTDKHSGPVGSTNDSPSYIDKGGTPNGMPNPGYGEQQYGFGIHDRVSLSQLRQTGATDGQTIVWSDDDERWEPGSGGGGGGQSTAAFAADVSGPSADLTNNAIHTFPSAAVTFDGDNIRNVKLDFSLPFFYANSVGFDAQFYFGFELDTSGFLDYNASYFRYNDGPEGLAIPVNVSTIVLPFTGTHTFTPAIYYSSTGGDLHFNALGGDGGFSPMFTLATWL